MDNITWVVQDNLIDPIQVCQVISAINKVGAKVQTVKVIPFVDDVDVPELDNNLVIPYGSTKLNKISQQRKWKGNWFDHSTFNVEYWNLTRKDEMLNYDSQTFTVRELIEQFSPKIGISSETLFFIRPLHDLKQFNGTVTTAKEICNWMQSVDSGNFSFDEETLVCIASPKHIKHEIRCFIVDGKIIDSSYYRIHGVRLSQPVTDVTLIEKINNFVLSGQLPHNCCVADIAILEDDIIKIIEFNAINSSGFYYHDIDKIVKAMTGYLYENSRNI